MKSQDEKHDNDLVKPLTGANIAPKGHGAGCPCCTPEDDELDEN